MASSNHSFTYVGLDIMELDIKTRLSFLMQSARCSSGQTGSQAHPTHFSQSPISRQGQEAKVTLDRILTGPSHGLLLSGLVLLIGI